MKHHPRVTVSCKIYSVSESEGRRLLHKLVAFCSGLRCRRAGWATGRKETTRKPWKKAKVRHA